MAGMLAPTLALLLVLGSVAAHVEAKSVEYDLTVARETLEITGKPVPGMTINSGIPGPTMRFAEGDTARITVHNEMPEATSIHWHGLLVPPGMDGVPYISFPPIEPDSTFVYEFPIRQSGTYWYHSHSGLQEQSGMYGAIVIDPLVKTHEVDREHVIVLSDWTDEDPHTVNRMLKRGSEGYGLEKGSAQSILGAARVGKLGAFLKRELQRMPPMDIADVAYDRFLANGKPEYDLPAAPGEIVRLRIVNGSATTYFHVEFAGGPMTVIAADGMEVEPIEESRILIAVAETYDVLVRMPESDAHEFRATAHDGSGHASVWLGSGERHAAPDVPRPNLYHSMGGLSLARVFALTPAGAMGMSDADVEAGKFDTPGMAGMDDMGTGDTSVDDVGMDDMGVDGMGMDGMGMDDMGMDDMGMDDMGMDDMSGMPMHDHGAGDHMRSMSSMMSGRRFAMDFRPMASDVSSSPELAVDGMDPRRPWPPYRKLRAVTPTNFDGREPARAIRLTLDGDMQRYVWFLNGKPLSESDSILIRKGEVVRFIMINRTMMHHPMHLHGHFFRVINGQGDFAPLKHTVNVSPMSTTVIEFDANEFGDWFFHCHLLYHMKAGMARVVHYEGYTVDSQLEAIRPALYKDPWYVWGHADVMSNMAEGDLTLANSRSILMAAWEAGWKGIEVVESEVVLTYDRYVNRFFTVFAGADLLAADSDITETRGVAGIRYLLPLNVRSSVWVDTDGGMRLDLEKELDLMPRLSLAGEAQYDTYDLWEGSVDLHYALHRVVSLAGQWHSEFGLGGGLQVRF